MQGTKLYAAKPLALLVLMMEHLSLGAAKL